MYAATGVPGKQNIIVCSINPIKRGEPGRIAIPWVITWPFSCKISGKKSLVPTDVPPVNIIIWESLIEFIKLFFISSLSSLRLDSLITHPPYVFTKLDIIGLFEL